MASNIIETPGIPSGNEQERLEQMYRYLCRLADDLNVNLQAIGGNDLTDEERQVMQQILVKSAEDAGVQADSISGQMLQMESLKSLIIKTAQFVQTKLDEYKLNLLRETVADGQFGKYLKRTKLDVDVTPEGIQQNYSLQETVEGLIKAEINARSYIKTGYLHDDENHLPVYGVAIGKEIVDFQVDGSVVYNDGNKVAELTADELSFWYNNTKVFYIKTGKLYTAGDFEIMSGGKLKISAGGTLDVNTTNFKIDSASGDFEIKSGGKLKINAGGVLDINTNNFKLDSATNTMKSGNFMLNNYGFNIDKKQNTAHVSNVPSRFVVGDEDNMEPSLSGSVSAIYYKNNLGELYDPISGTYSAVIEPEMRICAKNHNGNNRFNIHIKNSNPNTDIYDDTVNQFKNTNLGTSSYPFGSIYYKTLVQVSSRDVKHNIQPMKPPGERLDRLQPVTFVYNGDEKERTRQGLIWEDAVQVMPEICTDGDKEGKAINYTELIPMLLAEVQQLRARVSELERRQDNGKETE